MKTKLSRVEQDNYVLKETNRQLKEEIEALGGSLGQEFDMVVRRVANQKKSSTQRPPTQ